MIIKPKINRSFPAMCRYLLQEKNPEKEAEVLATHGVRSDSSAHMAADFDVVRSMRPGLGKAVMHVIIAFPSEEKGKVRWSRLGAQKQDVYFLSHERRKEQEDAG
jgi:hypothetical protein